MIILGIETSCDETAIAVVECSGDFNAPRFDVFSSIVSSQIALHAPFGGVVPNIAKREHGVNLVNVLKQALTETGMLEKHSTESTKTKQNTDKKTQIQNILSREQELLKLLIVFLETYGVPAIDAIAVTQGPGLEPALWVGLNFGKALALAWNKPLIPVNHMEGHVVAALLDSNGSMENELRIKGTTILHNSNPIIQVRFPALALLVSGGHTELVMMRDWKKYELIGQTRDDAVGEAFDKVARILGLSYPGGPEISKLAQKGAPDERVKLPRPMINSDDLDFSYSGLKTAVLYLVRNLGNKLDKKIKANIALEFEKAAVEVLVSKTLAAIEKTDARTLIVGGGVAANKRLRREIEEAVSNNYQDTKLLLPDPEITGDNAAMIAAAAYLHANEPQSDPSALTADGNLRLANGLPAVFSLTTSLLSC